MRILLCSATEGEIRPTLDRLQQQPVPGVEVLITGVGLLAATYHLTRAAPSRPDLMIQAGIAGSLDPQLQLGQVVLVSSEIVGDEGVEEGGSFRSLVDLGFVQADESPYVGGRLPNDPSGLAPHLETCVAVTINEISTAPARIDHYRRKWGARIESMEGAALHYVARKEGLPFLQLRSISNYVGERDKSKWAFGTAIAQLNEELQRLLQKLATA